MKHSKKPQKVLILKNRALGDSIISLGAIHYLRSLFPEAEIVYGVPHWIAPLFDSLQGPYNRILPMNFTDLRSAWSSIQRIHRESFDLILEMHQAGRTGKWFKALNLLSGVAYGYHNHHQKSGKMIIGQGVTKPSIQRDLDGVYSLLGIQGVVPNYLDHPPVLTLKEPPAKTDAVVFGVVATRRTKMWPLQSYLKLCSMLDCPVLIPLSKNPLDLSIEAELLKLGLPRNAQIVKVGLSELPRVMASARLYVGNDTGLKHLGVALGLKTCTFFGPEEPLEWHPYELEGHRYFYRENLACRTLVSHYCPLQTCESMICLNEFSPSSVFKELKNWNWV